MIATLKKSIRYGTRIFKAEEKGEAVEFAQTDGIPNFYDCYVKFTNHKPIGVFKEEIEIRDGQRST